MKKILGFIVVISLLGSALAYFISPSFAARVEDAYTFSACDNPQTYKIGSIDDRFKIQKNELIPIVEGASERWSSSYGKKLFQYDQANGEIVVNLTYDERQELTNQIGKLHEELDDEKNTIDPQIADFENRITKFKARVASLNGRIEYWNSRGGAPEDEFAKLHAEQQSLTQEQDELDSLAQKLNISTSEYNSQVGQLNQTIDTFNTALQTRPEEGLYNGRDNTITIFFMADRSELLHTLTHEFGHALGISHLPNPESVMYYQTNSHLNLNQEDEAALSFACRDRNIFDIASERLIYLGSIVESFFQKHNLIP